MNDRGENKRSSEGNSLLFTEIFILNARSKSPHHLLFIHNEISPASALCGTPWCLSQKFTVSQGYGVLLQVYHFSVSFCSEQTD